MDSRLTKLLIAVIAIICFIACILYYGCKQEFYDDDFYKPVKSPIGKEIEEEDVNVNVNVNKVEHPDIVIEHPPTRGAPPKQVM